MFIRSHGSRGLESMVIMTGSMAAGRQAWHWRSILTHGHEAQRELHEERFRLSELQSSFSAPRLLQQNYTSWFFSNIPISGTKYSNKRACGGLFSFRSPQVCCLHLCLCTTSIQYPQRPEKGIRYPGTGIIDNCELLCGCWEMNLGPLQE